MSYKRILVPMDGSATAAHGVDEAVRLARKNGARLMLLHVVEEQSVLMAAEVGAAVVPLIDDLRAEGKRKLERSLKRIARGGLKAQTALAESFAGGVAGTVVAQAKRWRADLIVVGSHGRTGVDRVLMGSDAEQIARRSPVPVLIVPARRRLRSRR